MPITTATKTICDGNRDELKPVPIPAMTCPPQPQQAQSPNPFQPYSISSFSSPSLFAFSARFFFFPSLSRLLR